MWPAMALIITCVERVWPHEMSIYIIGEELVPQKFIRKKLKRGNH